MANLNENSDIQGFLFSGYGGRMGVVSYHLLRVTDRIEAGTWLQEILTSNRITRAGDKKTDWCLNIAFTKHGLTALGLEDSELATFEVAFQDGMVSETRQNILGDAKGSDPKKWEWGRPDQIDRIHILLLVFGHDEESHKIAYERENKHYISHGLIDENPPLKSLPIDINTLRPNPKQPPNFVREHFGFADGISQPDLYDPDQDPINPDKVKAGEFVLGYKNEYDKTTKVPNLHTPTPDLEFGKNGSYLVFRQLEQDVAGFWNNLKNNANGSKATDDYLAAKIMGRWPNGMLVEPNQYTQPPTSTPQQIFGFRKDGRDPSGLGCPFGAHIRRVHPRDDHLGENEETATKVSNRHRILRRSRVYGPRIENKYEDDGKERGLFFICLCGNIERQFEFVQHQWINNPKFAGLYDEIDPLIGHTDYQYDKFRIPDIPFRRQLHGMKTFVTVKAGAYFFMPSMSALRSLASRSQT